MSEIGIKKYVTFFKNFAGEKYYIESAKKYLFIPLFTIWAAVFILFIFVRGNMFFVVALPIMFFVVWLLISYSKFWALFDYSKIVYYVMNAAALVVMYIAPYPLSLLWRYILEYI